MPATQQNVTTLLTLVAETTTGEGALLNTMARPVIDKNLRPQAPEGAFIDTGAWFHLKVSELTGTDMDFTVSHELDGQDYELATFTLSTGTEDQMIYIAICPPFVKIKYLENAITTISAVVKCLRF